VSRATCCSRPTGWAGLVYNIRTEWKCALVHCCRPEDRTWVYKQQAMLAGIHDLPPSSYFNSTARLTLANLNPRPDPCVLNNAFQSYKNGNHFNHLFYPADSWIAKTFGYVPDSTTQRGRGSGTAFRIDPTHYLLTHSLHGAGYYFKIWLSLSLSQNILLS